MTLWLVPAGAAGLSVAGTFDGLGLRGNASAPMTADGVSVPLSAMLGADGAGLDLALAAVLPVFLICSAAMSAGLMRTLAAETASTCSGPGLSTWAYRSRSRPSRGHSSPGCGSRRTGPGRMSARRSRPWRTGGTMRSSSSLR